MSELSDILDRANLRELGRFLLDPDYMERTNMGQTEEERMVLLKDNLDVSLSREGMADAAGLKADIKALVEASREIGFLDGMKAGARVLLELTDRSEIYY